MISELTGDLQNVGEYDQDVLDSIGTQVDLGDFVELINQYDVIADPDNDRYIVQDDVHQYDVKISQVSADGKEAYVFAQTTTNEFANDVLESGTVLEDDIREPNPGDEATFNDPSNALEASAERAPDRTGEYLGAD